MTAFATGLDVETSAAAGENAAENNAFFVPLVIAAAVTAYTAKQGDGDIVAGIDKILANEDTASKLFGELAQKGIENALVIAPESTQAALTVLALTGQLTDQAITYVDDATGNVVSGTWNNLSPETQQNIRRTGFVIEAAATVVTGAGAVNKLAKLPGVAKIEKAADGALSVKTAANKSQLIDNLVKGGTKITPEKVVDIRKLQDGRTVWLETGNDTAGLQHIYKRNEIDFSRKGISREEIPAVVMEALEHGNIVGTNGSANVYRIVREGSEMHVAIGVSSNGFVVRANPVSIWKSLP